MGARPLHSRVRRSPRRARYDSAAIHSILDASRFAHVAFTEDGATYCVPMLHARVQDEVYLHGSVKSRLMRTVASGAQVCLTVTRLRGLVLARSVFEHSANYESVMLLGRCHEVDDPAARAAALEAFTDKLVPGRWDEARKPTSRELKATSIVAMSIETASAKVRSGPPDDGDSHDAATDVWAGEIPIVSSFGAPLPSPGLRPGIPVPVSVRRLLEITQADSGSSEDHRR